MFKPSRILVPTDMSEYSYKAIRKAFDIAKGFESEIFLLHVNKDPIHQCTVDFCMSEEQLTQLTTQANDKIIQQMREQLAIFPYMDPERITMDIKTGVPHEEILKEAEEREIDLIVIASLGSSGLAKYLMGSVARHVLLGTKCSILLVK